MRALIAALVLSASCASAPPPAALPMVANDTDVIRLKSGEVVQESSFAPAKEKLDPVPPVRRGVPPSSWFPKKTPSEKVEVVEILFFEPHSPETCLGELAKPLAETPELTLFAEPGGRIVLSDPRKFGFHAHLEPGNIVRKPVGKPGLSIDISEKVESISFASPAQEMKTEAHASYAIPDAITARVTDLATAEATLASLPFAGGKAKETVDGTIWAFSLPRNDRQFWVYLFDGEKRHGRVMQACTVTYGEAVLAPDLVIDMVSADGKVVGRAMYDPTKQFGGSGYNPGDYYDAGTAAFKPSSYQYDPRTGELSQLEAWREQQLSGQGGFGGVDPFAYVLGGNPATAAWYHNVSMKKRKK